MDTNPDSNRNHPDTLVGRSIQDLLLDLPQLVSEQVAIYTFRIYATREAAIDPISRSKSEDQSLSWKYAYGGLVDELDTTEDMDKVMKRLIHHDVEAENCSYRHLKAEELTLSRIQVLLNQLTDNQVLALCSKCLTARGTIAHLPMIDFRCPRAERNQKLVATSIRMLEQRRGAILESGNSYHYIGFDLISDTEFISFAGKSLLLTPVTDPRYFAHRILSKTFVLRVSTSKHKPFRPVVVEEFGITKSACG